MSSSDFRLTICSDLDYEGMVVDINYHDQRVATLNCDKGNDKIEIQLMPDCEEPHTVPCHEFLRAVSAATAELLNSN